MTALCPWGLKGLKSLPPTHWGPSRVSIQAWAAPPASAACQRGPGSNAQGRHSGQCGPRTVARKWVGLGGQSGEMPVGCAGEGAGEGPFRDLDPRDGTGDRSDLREPMHPQPPHRVLRPGSGPALVGHRLTEGTA